MDWSFGTGVEVVFVVEYVDSADVWFVGICGICGICGTCGVVTSKVKYLSCANLKIWSFRWQ